MHTRSAKLPFEPEDGRYRSTLSNLERFLTPYVLDALFERFEIWRIQRGEPPRRLVRDGDVECVRRLEGIECRVGERFQG